MKPNYQEIQGEALRCSLSATTLVEAAVKLGPAFIYDLYCSNQEVLWVKGFMKSLACDTRGNPFSPYVNVIPCDQFRRDEWCLTLQGKEEGYGSKGL